MRPQMYLCICLMLLLSSVSRAQHNVTSATLSGRIEDASGAVVSGASITATHHETNQQLITTSDLEGRYRFPYLRIGDYDLKIDADGFPTVTKQLTVSVGQAIDLPITLEVAGISAVVNIGAD